MYSFQKVKMEERNRIRGYGVFDEDPETGRGYYTMDNKDGIPNPVPSVRMIPARPLGDITNRIQSDYKPTYNNYVEVKSTNGAQLIKVIPKENDPEMIPAELDFGWSELAESKRNTSHSTLIPSAGHHFKYGRVLPDLFIKLVRINIKSYGNL